MSKILFATNELKDVVFSLQMINECLAKVKEENLYWKWVLIALHNALQGFMVTCLCPFNPFLVMEEAPPPGYGSRKEWETWKGEPEKQPGPPRLLKFMDLYKCIKKPAYMEHVGGKAFKPKGTQTPSVKQLNYVLRNDFIHFMPKTKLALVQEFLPVLKGAIGIISFLALDSGSIAWVEREDLYSKTKDLLTSISAKMSELERIYAAASKEKRQPDPEVAAWIAAVVKRIESSTEE